VIELPVKTGFDYYNTDTNRYQDMRIKRLKKSFGCNGIAVYDYILCEIYRVKGCFLEWDENTAFDVADYFGIKESLVKEIVNYCAAVGLFDKELLGCERILTSQSIQKRYLEMSTRAKRTDCLIPKRVKLPEERAQIPEVAPQIPEVGAQIPEVAPKGEESKVKESKGGMERARAREIFSHPDEFQNDFEAFCEKWDALVADSTSPVKASERKWLFPPGIVINDYRERRERYGAEAVLGAIDRLRHAKFWHDKTVGMTQLLEERFFSKLLDGAYDKVFESPSTKDSKPDKNDGVATHPDNESKYSQWNTSGEF
jgi:hypothetical protein